MDGRSSLFVQSRLLSNPIVDLPSQGAIVIQACLENKIKKNMKTMFPTFSNQMHVKVVLGAESNLEHNVAVCFIELSMEGLLHLHRHKVLNLPN